jgi:hypothetical protein
MIAHKKYRRRARRDRCGKQKTKEGAARSRLWGQHLALRGNLCGDIQLLRRLNRSGRFDELSAGSRLWYKSRIDWQGSARKADAR